VVTATGEKATIEADYAIDADALNLAIAADSMNVASLRSQVALAAVPWLDRLESGVWSGQLRYRLGPLKSAWSGDLEVRDARVAVPGLADPLLLASAHARIDGAHLTLDRMEGQAGKIAFTGEYQYDPDMPRPHRVRLRADTLDSADLETEFQPALRRDRSLIARALGRVTLPQWMKSLELDGTVAINGLDVTNLRFEGVKTRILWDGARVQLDNLQGTLDGAPVNAKLAINLRAPRPAYKLTARVKGWGWQSGSLDAQVTADTAGLGAELLTNMKAEGTLIGTALDLGTSLPWHCVSGNFSLAWSGAAPKLSFTALSLRTGADTYTGQGGTQDGGRLLVTLSNGLKEIRISGVPGTLKAEEQAR
jgi:hypothetical protein